MKVLFGLGGMGRAELETLITSASSYRDSLSKGEPIPRVLSGKIVVNLFFEPSTRTRTSFEIAVHRLGGHVITFDPSRSSALKGESLADTVRTIAAMGVDVLVVRHAEEGIPERIHDWTGLAVINAGDGAGEHPTQALADALALKGRFGDLDGLRVAVVGDLRHSRVANSLIGSLPTLGADLILVGPPSLLPPTRPAGIGVSTDLDAVLEGLDVVYVLRVQRERGGRVDDDYHLRYGMTRDRAQRLGDRCVVMHPGPMNRGVEIASEVADGPRSLILEQVACGVPVRMATLAALAGETP
ncbi:MAG: aspartate carbamoyltransferase catalytic subunit [Acidimicrobiia bacterium]